LFASLPAAPFGWRGVRAVVSFSKVNNLKLFKHLIIELSNYCQITESSSSYLAAKIKTPDALFAQPDQSAHRKRA
jgi:hypothetical protein